MFAPLGVLRFTQHIGQGLAGQRVSNNSRLGRKAEQKVLHAAIAAGHRLPMAGEHRVQSVSPARIVRHPTSGARPIMGPAVPAARRTALLALNH